MRVFAKNKISPKGLVLSRKDFKLFIDEESITQDPEKMKRIIAKAESLLEDSPTTIPLWNFRQYMEQGSVAIYGSAWGQRLDKMFYLGVAEGYEKQGRFLYKLIDWIWAILEMSTWVIPEHTAHIPHVGYTKVPPVVGDKYMHGLELGSIYLAATLAIVYDMNKEAITDVSPIISERIEYELKNRIIRPYLNCDFYWEGNRGNKVNNWCPWNVSNILLVTALIEENDFNREKAVELALNHLDNFISWYKEDGGCDEGPTYWGAAAGSLFDCLETLYDMTGGKIDVYSEPLIKAMGEYVAKFNINANRFVNFADSSAYATHDGELLYRYGKKCGSDILTAFSGVMSTYNSVGLHFRHPYRAVKALLYPINKAEDVAPRAAKSVYFPDLKVMIERQSENPAEGLCLAVKGGNNGESHNHNDVGSFIVYYQGEPVLIDVGVGEYTKKTFSPQRYEIPSMQSRYHNLPMFDEIGEMQGGQYASCNEVYDPEERSFTAEIGGAYPKEVGVRSLVRKCALTDTGVTVTDRIELESERLIEFCFMTHKEATLVKSGEISLPEGRVLLYDADRLDCYIEEFFHEESRFLSTWKTDRFWRIRLSIKADGGSFNFTIK